METKNLSENESHNEWRELLELIGYGIIWSLAMTFVLSLLIFGPVIFPELVKEISGLIKK